MANKRHFNTSLVTLFLLSAIMFAFNATPSTVAIDDSESQISLASSVGQRLPTLFVFVLVVAGMLLLRVLRGELAAIPAPKHDRKALLLRIARGPPVM